MTRPFHLAIAVKDLELCRAFYSNILQCKEGRSSDHWVDFDFFGHQLVLHQKDDYEINAPIENNVDGHAVPVPHFGVVLKWEDWEKLSKHLKGQRVEFVIDPYIRFKNQIGEQATMFFMDPENNALEFKAFKNDNQLFAK